MIWDAFMFSETFYMTEYVSLRFSWICLCNRVGPLLFRKNFIDNSLLLLWPTICSVFFFPSNSLTSSLYLFFPPDSFMSLSLANLLRYNSGCHLITSKISVISLLHVPSLSLIDLSWVKNIFTNSQKFGIFPGVKVTWVLASNVQSLDPTSESWDTVLFIMISLLPVCVCVCECACATLYMWRLELDFGSLTLSFCHLTPAGGI